eukprot:g774.t1
MCVESGWGEGKERRSSTSVVDELFHEELNKPFVDEQLSKHEAGASLPDVIVERVDPKRRASFFHNEATGKTAWTKEEVERTEVAADVIVERFDPKRRASYFFNSATGKTAWTKKEVQRSEQERSRVAADQIVERVDPTRRASYFLNTTTGKTAWTRKEVERPLAPEAVEERVDPASGHCYYCNLSTGKTAWSAKELFEDIRARGSLLPKELSYSAKALERRRQHAAQLAHKVRGGVEAETEEEPQAKKEGGPAGDQDGDENTGGQHSKSLMDMLFPEDARENPSDTDKQARGQARAPTPEVHSELRERDLELYDTPVQPGAHYHDPVQTKTHALTEHDLRPPSPPPPPSASPSPPPPPPQSQSQSQHPPPPPQRPPLTPPLTPRTAASPPPSTMPASDSLVWAAQQSRTVERRATMSAEKAMLLLAEQEQLAEAEAKEQRERERAQAEAEARYQKLVEDRVRERVEREVMAEASAKLEARERSVRLLEAQARRRREREQQEAAAEAAAAAAAAKAAAAELEGAQPLALQREQQGQLEARKRSAHLRQMEVGAQAEMQQVIQAGGIAQIGGGVGGLNAGLAGMQLDGQQQLAVMDYSSIRALCASLGLDAAHAEAIEEAVSCTSVEELQLVLEEERAELLHALEGHITEGQALELVRAVERRPGDSD